MPVYGREDDLVLALKEANYALASDGRFSLISSVDGEFEAAQRVTQIADIYVAWLRRTRSVKITLVALEEQTMEVVATFATDEGGTPVSSMDTSQQLRYVIESADDRGFPVDASLTVEVTDPAVATATILEASSGTASGKDELLVVAVAPGSTLVKVLDAANPDVFGSDSVDVVPGGVAAVVLAAPVVEEQTAPEEPEPEV